MAIANSWFDNAIVSGNTYSNEKAYHSIFSKLRREDPVHWTEPEGVRPFWAITRYADIQEVERQSDLFINEPRMAVDTIASEERIREFTGGSHLLLRTIINMDNPDHKTYRGLTQDWFMPKKMASFEPQVQMLAEEYVDKMELLGGSCDFASDIATPFPLRVIMKMLGIPVEDMEWMRTLTLELFGSQDPRIRRADPETSLLETISDFTSYFSNIVRDRRERPRNDIASVIANAEVNGGLIDVFEAVSYYVVLLSAGHDTTGSCLAGGLLALLQNEPEFEKLRYDPALMNGAIDEMIRWVTPGKHFFRTAKKGYTLRGKHIQPGDSLMMCYPSANRDEDIFEDPFTFKIDRQPNRHIAFGYGPHQCLGQYLARMEMRIFFNELFSRVSEFSIVGRPTRTEACFINGLKSFPIEYTMISHRFASRA